MKSFVSLNKISVRRFCEVDGRLSCALLPVVSYRTFAPLSGQWNMCHVSPSSSRCMWRASILCRWLQDVCRAWVRCANVPAALRHRSAGRRRLPRASRRSRVCCSLARPRRSDPPLTVQTPSGGVATRVVTMTAMMLTQRLRASLPLVPSHSRRISA